MSRASFGSGYAQAGSDDALLAYLDAIAAVPAVAAAKRAATAALGLRPGDRALDLGCGTGVDLPLLAELVGADGAVVGVDPSPAALAAARRRLPDAAGVTLEVGEAERLPLADAAVDAARVDRVLQHVEATDVALAELRRVLRPGGTLVILEMGSRLDVPGADPDVTAQLGRRLMDLDRGHWIPLWLPALLARAGFRAVDLASEEAVSVRYRDADAVLRLGPALAEAVGDARLDASAAEAWSRAAHTAEARGELRLHLRFIRFTATAA